MGQKLEKNTTEENFFISAINQEIFNRVFPHIRHDLVGYLTTSLMRVSIMDRYLNRAELSAEQVKGDLKKIDLQLRDAILGIRELQFWDFDSAHEEYPSKILKKSVQLMSTHLAMNNIQLLITPGELEETEMVMTKPLLYCLLCLFSYVEDNNFEHNNLNISLFSKSVQIRIEPITAQESAVIKKKRNLFIDQDLASRFVALHSMDLSFVKDGINLTWH